MEFSQHCWSFPYAQDHYSDLNADRHVMLWTLQCKELHIEPHWVLLLLLLMAGLAKVVGTSFSNEPLLVWAHNLRNTFQTFKLHTTNIQLFFTFTFCLDYKLLCLKYSFNITIYTYCHCNIASNIFLPVCCKKNHLAPYSLFGP